MGLWENWQMEEYTESVLENLKEEMTSWYYEAVGMEWWICETAKCHRIG